MVEIPSRLEAVDALWLTEALRSEGHDAPGIRTVDYEPIGGTIGILGEVGIFTVTYDGETDLPRTMVGKCALDDDIARMYNAIMLFYKRETGFYRDLAEEVPLRVPECHLTVSDSERHLLLLEHVEDATTGDCVEGADFATMQRLVGDLARLHGRYWMSERIRDLPWMLNWTEETFLTGAPLLTGFWEQLQANEPDLIPERMRDFLARTYLAETEVYLQRMAQRPWTFAHGDYQLDNLLFTDDGEVVVLDWQGCIASFPGIDLGYLLATSGSEETIRREDELLDRYREALAEAGGPSWSREEVLDDLAWAMLYYVPSEAIPYQMDYSNTGEHFEHLRARFTKCMHECIAAAERWDMVGRVSRAIGE